MTDSARTRRDLFGLGVAAAAGVVAGELIAPTPAHAADGDAVLLGRENQANNPTVIQVVDSGQPGLHVTARTDDGAVIGENTASDGYGVAARGEYMGVSAVGGTVGVYSVSDYGTAVRGLTYDGVAVEARTAVDAGYALDVTGAVRMSRSGRATIPAGARSVAVAAPVRATSAVIATLQVRQSGVALEAAVPDAGARTVTFWLSRTTRVDLSVAWLLLD